jgi:hypothetical protein
MSLGMPAVLRLHWLALPCACLALLLCSTPALAQGWDPDFDDEPSADQTWDGEGWDGPGDGWDDPDPVAPGEDDPAADWTDPTDDSPEWGDDEPEVEAPPLVKTPTVAGRVAMLRTNGKASLPRSAPARVRAIIAAANRIVGKPYKWGGGHARLEDRGYDCSGAVSYALIRSGRLASPLVSGSFARWGVAGAGRWVTIYANAGHVYMEVAGLRLDTSTAGDERSSKGVRWRQVTGKRRGFKVRHIAGL